VVVLDLWICSCGSGSLGFFPWSWNPLYLAKNVNVDHGLSEILSGSDAEVVCIVVFVVLTGEVEYGVLPGS
jgi:hypothetical protein